ncbi:meiosis protein SPO22/ZIP4 like-domain-containing protein [Xylariales sp. PMI_506]|nr:meiosis protein SPO22/ZIP4 like-domain-containing protein [Xylariales sp. PMI_506]
MASQAPSTQTLKDKDKRAYGFIVFVQELREKLPNLDEADIQKLKEEIETQIHLLKSYSVRGIQQRQQLDTEGTKLWNLCTHLHRERAANSSPIRKLLVVSRIFALFTLNISQDTDEDDASRLTRAGRVAIKAAKLCIGELPPYYKSLEKQQPSLSEEEKIACRRFEAEYFILRTALVGHNTLNSTRFMLTVCKSWKEGRLDIAEHMYGKSESLMQRLDLRSAEDLSDVLYEIGYNLLKKQDFKMAVKWLERAHVFLSSQNLEVLSRNAVELRLAISQALVKGLLGLNSAESHQKAESHVSYMESEIGAKFIVLLLRLEILLSASGETVDVAGYADALQRMISTSDLTEPSYKIIINHIRNLDGRDHHRASLILDNFLIPKVLGSQNDEWKEKTIILRVFLETNGRDSKDSIDAIKNILDLIEAGTERPLRTTAASAIQTLIWKKMDAYFAQGEYMMCKGWCQLALHSILREGGPVTSAIITRKLFLCALQTNDLEMARGMYETMSESIRSQPMTIYLAYRLGLHSGDQELAARCIEQIANGSQDDLKFLYACCVDAQECGNKSCALEALKQLAEKHTFDQPGPVYFPALLRSIIRLHTSILNDGISSAVDFDMALDDLCKVFEGMAMLLQRNPRDENGSKLFTVAELNWFCKNAYNLALEHSQDWGLRHIVRLLQACKSIMEYYPQDLPAEDTGDISLRGIFCSFIISTTYTALAREEDSNEKRLQYYLALRKYVTVFESELEGCSINLDEGFKQDLHSKFKTLIVFDFEAAVSLKNWEDLPNIARKAKECSDVNTLQAMVDCVLKAEKPPIQVLFSTIRTIINEIWLLENFDVAKLAKYLRCLVQITLPDKQISLNLLVEIGKPFPMCEVEWLTTTSFNHGIDFYQSGEDDLSRKWIDHAFTLAHFHQDGGVLETLLQDHYTRLRWDS